MDIQIPSCTHPFFIHKHIHIFLNEQENSIPVEMISSIAGGGSGIIGYFSSMMQKDKSQEKDTSVEKVEDSDKEKEDNNVTTDTIPTQDSNQISLKITTNNSDPIESLKGTKLYYLYQRNGQCARWV
jgi:hypothetical protein